MLSLVVFAYSKSEELKQMTRNCLDSYAGQADEVIVIEDGGDFTPYRCDKYYRVKVNYGFTWAVNMGLRLAVPF